MGTIRELYDVRQKIKLLTELEGALRQEVIDSGGGVDGDYVALVEEGVHRTVRWKELADSIGVPQSVIAEFTRATPKTTVRVAPRHH